jgi:RNA polymerase sigma factor (sigma-70 family)
LEQLSETERLILRLYYVEGKSFEEVRHRLMDLDVQIDRDGLIDALRRIDQHIDSRTLKRYAYDLHAVSVGAISGRLLEFLDWWRGEQEALRRDRNPEQELIEKEARQLAADVHTLLDCLPEEEREVLSLRFDKEWSAKRIADELGIPGARRVYTIVDRGLRRLRSLIVSRGLP